MFLRYTHVHMTLIVVDMIFSDYVEKYVKPQSLEVDGKGEMLTIK